MADSVECYIYLRNVTDLMSDGKTPCERRFGMPFKGPVTPFGAMDEHHPISAKDLSRLHQFGGQGDGVPKAGRKQAAETSQESINLERKSYLDCSLDTLCTRGELGRVTLDIIVADIEELETMDASEICSERLNAKEVMYPKANGKEVSTPQNGEDFNPDRRWKSKLSGGDQVLSTSTLIRDHPDRGEEQGNLLR